MRTVERKWIEEALKKFESPLTRYAVSLLGDLDRARDVVQETFLRLCEQEPGKVREHLPQWLFTVCRNLAFDLYRKEKRMDSIDAGVRPEQVAEMPDPADLLEKDEQLSRIDQLLGELTPNQREVVRLKFQNDLSYREISRVTGLTVTNVGFLIHTAVRTIRDRRSALESGSGMRRVK